MYCKSRITYPAITLAMYDKEHFDLLYNLYSKERLEYYRCYSSTVTIPTDILVAKIRKRYSIQALRTGDQTLVNTYKRHWRKLQFTSR